MTITKTTTATSSGQPAGTAARARHLAGLTDVAEVRTDTFQLAQVQLARVVRTGGIAAVSGRPGCGKTFSVDYFMRHHPAMDGRVWHWLDMPPKPTTKEVTLRLLRGLGARFNPRDSEYVLTEDLVPLLAGSGMVVVIDEAQNLRAEGLQQLRYLHDRCRPLSPDDPPGWALILVGSTVDRALAGAAELASRVSTWVEFTRLEDQQLIVALRAWSPLLADLPPDVLLRIDARHGRGNWRNWAQFLAAYTDLHTRRPPNTTEDRKKLVRAALAAVNKNKGTR